MKNKILFLGVTCIVTIIGAAIASQSRQNQFLYVRALDDTKGDRCTWIVAGITTNPALGGRFSAIASTKRLTSGCDVIDVYNGE